MDLKILSGELLEVMPLSSIRFVRAEPHHDAEIRRTLHDTSMGSWVRLSFEREPNYFHATGLEGEQHTILAIENDRVVCMGSVTVRERFFNGQPERVGYLGQLRLADSHRGRFDILRAGHQAFRRLHEELKLKQYFTSIIEDNHRAVRLFQRGLPGFPKYRYVNDVVTAVISMPWVKRSEGVRSELRNSGLSVRHGSKPFWGKLSELMESRMPEFQYGPRWTENELLRMSKQYNLREESTRFLLRDETVVASAALWDQRTFKQTVVTHYSRAAEVSRIVNNVWVSLMRGVTLPPVGQPIEMGYISHLALPREKPEWIEPIVRLLFASAVSQKLNRLTIGLDTRDPLLGVIKRAFKPRLYPTRIYQVAWPDEEVDPPDKRLIYPEIALL